MCTDQTYAASSQCMTGTLYKGGVAWSYAYPPESATDACRAEWSDPGQHDADGDGVGDVCDPDPVAAQLDLSAEWWSVPAQPNTGAIMVFDCIRDEYRTSWTGPTAPRIPPTTRSPSCLTAGPRRCSQGVA